jgi:xanthine dehydrogenase molybdopterin-binding subunit B
VPPGAIDLITADTARTPDEGLTAGSHSMQDGGTAMANACANVRMLLTRAAAQRWQTKASNLPPMAPVTFPRPMAAGRAMANWPPRSRLR